MNNKFIIILFLLLVNYITFALDSVTFNYASLSLGQNIGYLKVDEKSLTDQYKNDVNRYIPFSSVSFEFIRITKIPFSLSLSNDNLYGFKNNGYINSDLHTLFFNIGLIREYEKNLSYKNGYRSIALYISGGFVSKSFDGLLNGKNNVSGGCQLNIRYLNGHDIYEPVYSKLFFFIDKLDSGVYLYRAGLSICFDSLKLF